MATITTLIKVYAEQYRHVPERILDNKARRSQELPELIYTVAHDATTSPEQEAVRLVAALKLGAWCGPGTTPSWTGPTGRPFPPRVSLTRNSKWH